MIIQIVAAFLILLAVLLVLAMAVVPLVTDAI